MGGGWYWGLECFLGRLATYSRVPKKKEKKIPPRVIYLNPPPSLINFWISNF